MKIDAEFTVQERVASPETPALRPAGRSLARVPAAMLRRAVGVATFGVVQVGGRAQDAPDRRRTFAWPSGYKTSFVLMVVVPSLVSWIYLAFIASNQYVAETRFAVRTAQPDAGSAEKSKQALSSAGSGSSVGMAGQDAYVVTTYIHSRAVIDDLAKAVDIRAIFTRPEGDFWARLKPNASIEELLAYWRSMVGAHVDNMSGVVTVSVRSFRPQDSVDLAAAIVTVSETLANTISARARNDAMRRGEQEVRRAEARVQTALADMRSYRDKEGYLDPTVAASSTLTLLTELMGQKMQLQNDIFVATRLVSAEAPQLKSLQTRLVGLDQQIEGLRAELTGNSAERQTVAASLTRFEELELHRGFAEKLYTMAQDGLERARLKAEQQAIYISVFVPPSLPEDSKFPERFSLSAIIPIGLLVIWGIVALMAAAIDDHRH